MSCGSQNVWACDANGMVYFRVGTQPLNPSMMLPAWICIEPPEQVKRLAVFDCVSSSVMFLVYGCLPASTCMIFNVSAKFHIRFSANRSNVLHLN